MSARKTLILGASGLLGRETVPAFSSLGDVVAVSRQGGRGTLGVDIRDREKLSALVRETRPDVVLLLAAYREPDFCEEHPGEARRLNVEPARVLRDCLPAETRLLFVSTDYVFDGEHPPYREDSPRAPVNVYGQTKVEAEDLLFDRPHTIILRVPLLIGGGPRLADCGFIRNILEDLESSSPRRLDDVLVRVPAWTRDVAKAMRLLVERDAEGTFHFSGPRGQTRYAWTVEIGRLLGKPVAHLEPSPTVIPRRARRPRDSSLDDRKIRALGATERTDFADAIRIVLVEVGAVK